MTAQESYILSILSLVNSAEQRKINLTRGGQYTKMKKEKLSFLAENEHKNEMNKKKRDRKGFLCKKRNRKG